MLKKIVKNNWSSLVISVLAGWLEVIFNVQALLLIGGLLDIATGNITGNLTTYILKILCFALLVFVMGVVQRNFEQKFSINATSFLRKNIIESLYKKPTSSFYLKSRDEYIGLLETDIDQLRLNYFGTIADIIKGIGQVVIYTFALLKFNILIFIVSIVVSFLPMIINKSFVKPLNKLQMIRSEKNSTYLEKLNELIAGYSTIKRSKNSDYFIENFERADKEKLEVVRSNNTLATGANQGLFVANIISIGSIILVGSLLISRGQVTIAEVIAAMSIISTGSNALGSTLRDILQFNSSKGLMDKVLKDYHEIKDSLNETEEINLPVEVRDLNLSFNNKIIFKDFSIDFTEGRTYAIVGDSGSGKTTLARILLKELDLYDGNVFYNDDNIKNISESSIYDLVDYIPQNPYIFKENLMTNITMFNKFDQDKYLKAINDSNLEDLFNRFESDEILKPENLSGGEKQRIAIARSLYKESKLIILDEPTSGLDPENTKKIENLIFSLNDRTRIVITHNWDKNYLSRFDQVIKIGSN